MQLHLVRITASGSSAVIPVNLQPMDTSMEREKKNKNLVFS